MSRCKFAKLIRDGKSSYPLEEHQRDCDTCQADLEIERLTAWPDGFIEEILTLLDRIEVEEDATLASQRHDIAEKHGLTVEFCEIVSGRAH